MDDVLRKRVTSSEALIAKVKAMIQEMRSTHPFREMYAGRAHDQWKRWCCSRSTLGLFSKHAGLCWKRLGLFLPRQR